MVYFHTFRRLRATLGADCRMDGVFISLIVHMDTVRGLGSYNEYGFAVLLFHFILFGCVRNFKIKKTTFGTKIVVKLNSETEGIRSRNLFSANILCRTNIK